MPSKARMVKGARMAALYRNPTMRNFRCGSVIDLKLGSTYLSLSHMDMASTQAVPLPDTQNTFSSRFWGCKQFGQLYQRYRLVRFSYQWVPSVAFTWSGSVAMKVVDDPLDATFLNSSMETYMNAPSSTISPIYAPSPISSWSPRDMVKKFCCNTLTITQQDQQGAGVIDNAFNVLPLTQARSTSYGTFVADTFGVTLPDGGVPDPSVILGRIVIVAELTYESPVPLHQTDELRYAPIKPVNITPNVLP